MSSTQPGRDELSATLADLRADTGMSLAAAARAAGMSAATVHRYETGRYVPTPAAVERLARALSAPAPVRRHLAALAADLRARTTPRQVLLREGAAGQARFGAIEAASGHVQTFHPAMVPGLLQTRAYAAAVIAGAGLDEAAAREWVAARLARQAILGDGTRKVTQVVTEGALRWQLGGPAVMAEQVEHLARVARLGPPVRVGIIPWHRPVEVVVMHGFDLYDARAVIVGTETGTAYLTRPADVAAFSALFAVVVGVAVFGEAAVGELQRIAAEFRALTH